MNRGPSWLADAWAVVLCSARTEGSREWQRVTGTVKWFNEGKGCGFASRQAGDDVSVHFSAIAAEGFRTLYENQKAEFTVDQGLKGLQAVDVRSLQPSRPQQCPA